jgi:tripartite-type tricarboxylate transporter receptor subunit TctC
VKDLAPVARWTIIAAMLVVHPSVPANSVLEPVAWLKANPNKVSFGSAGNGTTSHLAGILFRNLTGTDIVHVPYKGGGPALAGLLAGDVQMMVELMVSVYPHAKAGKMRGLAVPTKQRVFSAARRAPHRPNTGPRVAASTYRRSSRRFWSLRFSRSRFCSLRFCSLRFCWPC